MLLRAVLTASAACASIATSRGGSGECKLTGNLTAQPSDATRRRNVRTDPHPHKLTPMNTAHGNCDVLEAPSVAMHIWAPNLHFPCFDQTRNKVSAQGSSEFFICF